MTAVFLHLSDIHIKTSQDPVLKRAEKIGVCVYGHLPAASHVFIVVSGDIAFSGEEDQYAMATEFFSGIRDVLSKETSVPISFIFVPGNHDCNFSADNTARKLVVEGMEQNSGFEIDESIIEICTAIQEPFFAFRDELEKNQNAEGDKLWRRSKFEVEGKVLGFECLNVSWASKIQEVPGRLFFPVDNYRSKDDDSNDVTVVIMHHPLNWFNQSIYRHFRTFIRQLADIVITGHEHQGNVGVIQEAVSYESAFVEGGVLQNDNDFSDSSFNVIILDIGEGQFSSTSYAWKNGRYVATEDGSWSGYHALPAKRVNPFTISELFQRRLDDPGAFFKHPGRDNITLSDIFVYPDLRKIGDGNEIRREFVNSLRLLPPDVTADGVLLEGEEKTGRTSLLFQVYREYHDRGFVPVYIQGKEVRNTTDAEIDALVRRAVEAQYGNCQVEFDQLSPSQKLLLLDDFDDGPLRAAHARAAVLCTLRKRFGHLIVTVSEMFEMREMLDGNSSHQLLSLVHYKLQPFGYALRSKLIERWFSLGADGTIDESTFIARCDQAERLMDAVMAKTIIPSIPLYLLTLLQSMDAGRSGDFKETALGHYYHYLLTEALQNCGVKADKFTEIFQYAAHLAWEFHVRQKRELSETELRNFNQRFSRDWVTVDFGGRLDVLVKARVLYRVGDDFSFRYPYVYYYLKGQYLSENISNECVREYIGKCCKHLYVRDHANTVLFLAHHTNDNYVLNAIVSSLHGLFMTCAPLTFDGDTNGIRQLIVEAPKLTYKGGTPVEHRRQRNELKDKLDDGGDGLVDSEEQSEELSLVAQMTMLFKTTEILGQVLKNQYAKIPRNRKAELLEELFNGPLRAIRYFYDYFEKNPEGLVAEVEAAIQRKGGVEDSVERKKIAQKVVSGVIQFVTFAFVMRAAQGANSDSLKEDVENVVKKNNTLAFRLIELGIYLDSPKPIPRERLGQIYKDAQKDPVAAKLVRIMVLSRLYMFKTTERDMQWINDALKIDIDIQHSIMYHDNKRRLVK